MTCTWPMVGASAAATHATSCRHQPSVRQQTAQPLEQHSHRRRAHSEGASPPDSFASTTQPLRCCRKDVGPLPSAVWSFALPPSAAGTDDGHMNTESLANCQGHLYSACVHSIRHGVPLGLLTPIRNLAACYSFPGSCRCFRAH